jgi:hypothetical protein
MRFPKGHEITRALADVGKEPNRPTPYDTAADRRRKLIRKYVLGNRRNRVEWGEPAGPVGMTKMFKHHRLLKLAKPYYYFHPIHFSFWRCAWDDTFRDGLGPFRASYCIHLSNEKIRRGAAMNKDGPFPRHSLSWHPAMASRLSRQMSTSRPKSFRQIAAVQVDCAKFNVHRSRTCSSVGGRLDGPGGGQVSVTRGS